MTLLDRLMRDGKVSFTTMPPSLLDECLASFAAITRVSSRQLEAQSRESLLSSTSPKRKRVNLFFVFYKPEAQASESCFMFWRGGDVSFQV